MCQDGQTDQSNFNLNGNVVHSKNEHHGHTLFHHSLRITVESSRDRKFQKKGILSKISHFAHHTFCPHEFAAKMYITNDQPRYSVDGGRTEIEKFI